MANLGTSKLTVLISKYQFAANSYEYAKINAVEKNQLVDLAQQAQDAKLAISAYKRSLISE